MLVTETAYDASMRLPSHSHGSSHLAILLEGSYVEWIDDRAYLCVPGDAIHYSPDVQHDNLFGNRRARCLNLEFDPEFVPVDCQANRICVPTEVRSLIECKGRLPDTDPCHWLFLARSLVDSEPATSLSPLAEEVAVHPNHLARAFRKTYGMSVGQYSLLQRIRKAGRLIIETDKRLADLALEAGFYDQSHFTNAFHQVTGFTPASLRNLVHA